MLRDISMRKVIGLLFGESHHIQHINISTFCLLTARQRRQQASMLSNTTGTGAAASSALDSRVESMAAQIKDVLPQVPITAIRKDISMLPKICLLLLYTK